MYKENEEKVTQLKEEIRDLQSRLQISTISLEEKIEL